MNDKLKLFYSDLRNLMKKHGLTMECMDNYDGRERWSGQTFTLRSKEAVNDRFEIYTESLNDFVENGSD